MAQAQCTPRIDRATRAAGILERHECVPQEDGKWLVRDTATGSGRWHLATPTSCDCYDASSGHQCKHQRACQAEAIALASYAADWDCAVAQQQPRCPMCGCPIEARSYYVGGHGYQYVSVCSGDSSHSNRRPGSLDHLPEC
jgi:hypothetical protein